MTMNKKRRRRGRRRMSYWANDKIRASFGVTLVYLLRYRVPLLDIYRSWHLEWFSWRIHSVVSNHRRILLLRKDSQAWIAPGKTSKTIHNGKYIYYYLAQKVYAWLCDCQIQFNHICNLFFFPSWSWHFGRLGWRYLWQSADIAMVWGMVKMR